MVQIYEGMFLIDNDVVRSGWAQAKAVVTDLISKHGGTVHTSRRWGERPLAYPVKRRRRATYLLVHYDVPGPSITGLLRDLEINETVLRHLLLRVEAVPEKELELARGEESPDFAIPEPPADDEVATEEALLKAEADEEEAGDDEDLDAADEDEPVPVKPSRKAAAPPGAKPAPALAGNKVEEREEV